MAGRMTLRSAAQAVVDAFPPSPGTPRGDALEALREALEEPMTQDALTVLAEKATPGPWTVGLEGFGINGATDEPGLRLREDSEFIVALVNAYRAGHLTQASEATGVAEGAGLDPERLGLSVEQTAILRDLLTKRQQTVSEWLGDVLFEYGLGRPPGRDYAPPSTTKEPTDA